MMLPLVAMFFVIIIQKQSNYNISTTVANAVSSTTTLVTLPSPRDIISGTLSLVQPGQSGWLVQVKAFWSPPACSNSEVVGFGMHTVSIKHADLHTMHLQFMHK